MECVAFKAAHIMMAGEEEAVAEVVRLDSAGAATAGGGLASRRPCL